MPAGRLTCPFCGHALLALGTIGRAPRRWACFLCDACGTSRAVAVPETAGHA